MATSPTDAAVDFCRAREEYLRARRSTSDERSETADAIRTVGGLLTESMLRHGVSCVRVERPGDGARYVRVTPERRRATALRSTEDVLELLQGISREVRDVPAEELPRALARIVQVRARARGTVVPPRVQVTTRAAAREPVLEMTQVAREVETLARQMNDSHSERRQMRERMQPLREALRERERALTTALPAMATTDSAPAAPSSVTPSTGAPNAPLLVQMQQGEQGRRTVLQVCRQSVPRKCNVFGIRRVCGYVQTAVEAMPVTSDRGPAFESALACAVRAILDREQERTPSPRTKIVVRRQRVA
ncbi:MAG: hypothetical protein VXW74_00555 [Candidatus Thermoplasmatota archaeon]|nr:hypothetical protein [Candidatus Thermoplasmatota archaeon]